MADSSVSHSVDHWAVDWEHWKVFSMVHLTAYLTAVQLAAEMVDV